MAEIKKFSLVYDAAEDRIAWDTEDADGAATRLWLTQRMCRDLVAALIPRLPKTAAPQDTAPEHESTVQSWEQAAAMQTFGRTTGVQVKQESIFGLVSAVHINPTGAGMNLSFDFAGGQNRAISMDAAAIRQTMTILHGLFTSANWPTDVWPAWIAQPAQPASNVRSLN